MTNKSPLTRNISHDCGDILLEKLERERKNLEPLFDFYFSLDLRKMYNVKLKKCKRNYFKDKKLIFY